MTEGDGGGCDYVRAAAPAVIAKAGIPTRAVFLYLIKVFRHIFMETNR